MILPTSPLILPLASDKADLPLAGGKGANLARLSLAGYPVPAGFLLTTQAYRDFVAANELEERILALLPRVGDRDPDLLEQASREIQSLFTAGQVPEELAGELRMAYASLASPAVAVRSSATAEDLPEMSFAGQQDTFLNVIGTGDLLQAVVECWSSLWTARAIGYRIRNGVPHAHTALAVVVQEMIESQASGVMFTANPLSGLRSETVIDAVLGLGEALVSGQVEPDHYVVDPSQGVITAKALGMKAISIHAKSGGGTQVDQQNRVDIQALPDTQILALARLGSQVAETYGFPQDIEWAWADEQLYLLQSRPVTALFPLPAGLPAEPLKVLVSFAAVQGVLDPITPLGQDAMRELAAAGTRLFRVEATRQTQVVLLTAGERIWVNFSAAIKNSVGRRIVPVVFELVEPSVRQAAMQIWDDPRLQPDRPGISSQARNRLAHFMLPVAFNLLQNLASPRRRREAIIAHGERLLQMVESRCSAIRGNRWEKLAQQAGLMPGIAAEYLPRTFILFFSGVAAGMASWSFLERLAGGLDPASNVQDLMMQVTRGMPYNPTTEMDLALWQMARSIRSDPAAWLEFQDRTASELSARYLKRDLPETACALVDTFLVRYGGRGLGEIDLGRPRWAEDPTHVFEMLFSFLQIEDQTQAPDIVFAAAARSAELSVDQLIGAIRKTHNGWLKARLARFFAGRARQLMGIRESPKFFAVRLMYLIHRELLKTGQEFVLAGELNQADDLFYLTFSELEEFAAQKSKDWHSLIATRRELYQREMRRRQIPRLLLSDGRAFYAGLNSLNPDSDIITGSPVSPGSVEGRVRIVLDPRQAGLLPGEILVCPGTDPSWTPLFLTAGGLVLEVGGMMTHGAVVAREFGIPAIVGVDQATTRLHTGQLIRLDGSRGEIIQLEG